MAKQGSASSRPRIANGYVFRTVFGEDTELCVDLLRVCLEIDAVEVSFVQPEKIVEASDDHRAGRLDLYVVDANGNRYDIEIQDHFRKDEWLRARHYQALMDATYLRRGGAVADIPHSVVLFICNFDPFGKDLRRYDLRTCCMQTGEYVDDRRLTVFLNARGKEGGEQASLDAFLRYVAGEDVKGDPFVDKINAIIDERVKDPKWMEEYMTFQDALDAERYYGQQQGLEMGLEMGREQGRLTTLVGLVRDGIVPMEFAAERAEVSLERMRQLVADGCATAD